MVLPKSKNAVGLGNSLMNDRFKNKSSNLHRASAQNDAGAITRKDQSGNNYITPAKKEAEWMKMRSVTEQGALDEFLSTAELAGTDFTAEKMTSVKIIQRDGAKNPYLLSREEERRTVRKQQEKKARLTVPRRPKWDEHTTPNELDRKERESLLEWRRGLAELQEVDDLLMTPFERNLEVWRQLWRVIERCDLVVQIVDARNPLLFRCEDLEKYVKEVDGRKRNLLLVNKADMMTERQRRSWAKWFGEKGVNFRFFSAELAREMNEAREEDEEEDEEDVDGGDGEDGEEDVIDEDDVEEEIEIGEGGKLEAEAAKISLQEDHEDDEQWTDEESIDPTPHPETTAAAAHNEANLSLEEQTRILTTDDLEALFIAHSPTTPSSSSQTKTQIGLVGYPNVGKSSTINALLGAKKVSVSATPGKTKHFQTIHLSSRVILCDCPGLVFPNFATTKAELVCAGVLPIDQLREYSGPATLVAQRIPKRILEGAYGMTIAVRPAEEGGTGQPTGEEVLRAYARARGFWTQGLGQPDESRAARTVLKDYVKGKLLFVHPPPAEDAATVDAETRANEFNRELYDAAHLPTKRYIQRAGDAELQDGDGDASLMDEPSVSAAAPQGKKGRNLDKQFFAANQSNGNVMRPFHYKYSEQGQAAGAEAAGPGGKQLSGRKLKAVKAMEMGVDPSELSKSGSKKHFKGNKRAEKQTRLGGPRGGLGDTDYD